MPRVRVRVYSCSHIDSPFPHPAPTPIPGLTRSNAALIASIVEGYVHDANTVMWTELPAVVAAAAAAAAPSPSTSGDNAFDGAADLPAACSAAAARWRSTIALGVPEAQAAFDAGEAPPYLRHLIALTTAGLCGCWLLTCVTTGRVIAADDPVVDADTVDADADAANAAINDGGRRPPPCTAMQGRWILAFTLLLAATFGAGLTAFHALWDFGESAKAVEYAAKPLSGARNWDVNATTGEILGWGRMSYPGKGPRRAGAAGGDGGAPWGWIPGEFASALHAVKAPPACAAAMQPWVAPLAAMPPVLRVSLGGILPPPLPALVRGVASLRAALRPYSSDASSGSPPPLLVDDALVLKDDPLAGSSVSGWLDGGGAALVMPSHAGVSFMVVEASFYVMLTCLGTTLLADWLAASVPRWRAEWGRRGAQAARVAARPVHTHAD